MEAPDILSTLTDDLLSRIYTFISDDSDRKSFRATCKSFYVVDSLQRTRLRVLRPEFLHRLLSNFTSLDSLDFSVCPRVDDGAVSVIFRNGLEKNWMRRLRKVVLSRSSGLSFSGLERMIRNCPFLEFIDVSYCCAFGDMEASAISGAINLRDLRIDRCLGVTDVGLAKIAVGCVMLERLSMKWCFEISDIGIDLLSKKCVNLKHLDISYLKVTNESLRCIGSMKKLEVLEMVGCGLVGDLGMQYLGNGCPKLQAVDMSRCEKLSSSALLSVIKGHGNLMELRASHCFFVLELKLLNLVHQQLHFNPISLWKEFNQLRTLTLDGTCIAPSSFEIISSSCQLLTEIGLSKCRGVGDAGIIQLVSGCTNLKIMDLTCCIGVTGLAITAIAESCRDIVCLKLECCNLTEKSLQCLGFFCLRLEELDLTDCPGLNDVGVSYLSKCTKLSCLKLGLCNISDKGLSSFASKCKEILELDLYWGRRVNDDGLAAISTGCVKLKKLNLSYCAQVTDRGLNYLALLEHLSDLEMRGLVNITGAGMTAVAAGCKRLSELDIKHCNNIDDSGFWALAQYSKNLMQINLSNCAISDVGLCLVMGNLTRLQNANLVNLINVSAHGLELALRACCGRLKKVKLLASLRLSLSQDVIEMLAARGCRIRWD